MFQVNIFYFKFSSNKQTCFVFVFVFFRVILSTRYYMPELADSLCQCVVDYKATIGRAFAVVLFACFLVNFTPSTAVLTTCVELLLANITHLNATDILNTALALSLFRNLPKSVVDAIFHLQFLEKVDSELEGKNEWIFYISFILFNLNYATLL